jgi:hypothetical protein
MGAVELCCLTSDEVMEQTEKAERESKHNRPCIGVGMRWGVGARATPPHPGSYTYAAKKESARKTRGHKSSYKKS